MLNQFFMKQSSALLIFLTLVGCAAGTFVESKSEPLIPTYRLKSAQVTWVNNPSVSYNISLTTNRLTPLLTEADKASVLAPYKADSFRIMGQLLSSFSEQLVPKVRTQLTRNNVYDGNDIVLELFPVSVHHAVNGGRRIHVRATIRQGRDSKEVWSVTIAARGRANDENNVLLDGFTNTLMDELKKAGWLENSRS